jgi:alkaline phosphatase D
MKDNPCLKTMIDHRGYLLCDVDHRTWRGELKILDSVMRPGSALSTFAAFVAEPREPGLKQGA